MNRHFRRIGAKRKFRFQIGFNLNRTLAKKRFFVCLPQFESNNFNGKAEKRKFLSGWLSSRISFPFRSNFSKLYFDFFLGAWLLTQLLISRVSLSRLVYIHAFAGPYSIKIFSVSIYNALELKGSDWWLQVTWPFSTIQSE